MEKRGGMHVKIISPKETVRKTKNNTEAQQDEGKTHGEHKSLITNKVMIEINTN